MRIVSKIVHAAIVEVEELNKTEQILIYEAMRVRKNAQAPYSHFLVGAAVESSSGEIYKGCNVERASYSQTTHAEQNAIDSMVAKEGSAKIRRIAIVGGSADLVLSWPIEQKDDKVSEVGQVLVPCGHCLQIIWENCHNDPEVELIGLCHTGEIAKVRIADAFPMRFGPANLGINYNEPTTK